MSQNNNKLTVFKHHMVVKEDGPKMALLIQSQLVLHLEVPIHIMDKQIIVNEMVEPSRSMIMNITK